MSIGNLSEAKKNDERVVRCLRVAVVELSLLPLLQLLQLERHARVIFFFNETATTEIYTFPYTTLFRSPRSPSRRRPTPARTPRAGATGTAPPSPARSEEHTSELQSHSDLVCRLLLEKKKKKLKTILNKKKKKKKYNKIKNVIEV